MWPNPLRFESKPIPNWQLNHTAAHAAQTKKLDPWIQVFLYYIVPWILTKSASQLYPILLLTTGVVSPVVIRSPKRHHLPAPKKSPLESSPLLHLSWHDHKNGATTGRCGRQIRERKFLVPAILEVMFHGSEWLFWILDRLVVIHTHCWQMFELIGPRAPGTVPGWEADWREPRSYMTVSIQRILRAYTLCNDMSYHKSLSIIILLSL